MRTIPIATGMAAVLLATALVAAGPARSQPAPQAPDDNSEEMMTFGFDDGPDAAPWDDGGSGPAFAPRAGRGGGQGMACAPGGRGGPGRGMHAGRRGARGGGGTMLGPIGRLIHAGPRLAEELDLTSAQQEKLQDIAEGLARSSIQNRADMQTARLDMGKLLRADTPDRARIAAKIDEIARMRATHQKRALDAGLEARKVLTAEQLEKFKALRPGFGQGKAPGQGRGARQGRGRAPGAGGGL